MHEIVMCSEWSSRVRPFTTIQNISHSSNQIRKRYYCGDEQMRTWWIVPRGKYSKSPASRTTSRMGSSMSACEKFPENTVHYEITIRDSMQKRIILFFLPLENRGSFSASLLQKQKENHEMCFIVVKQEHFLNALSYLGLYRRQCFFPSSCRMKASISS